MRYASAGAFRSALEQRLLTRARESNIPVARLRKLVVFDRLIARLLQVAGDRWILKGAVALHFRLGARFRTTMDMDLSRQDSEHAATADFLAAQALELDDYFHFDIQKTARLAAALEGAAVRYHVSAELAGRLFEEVIVDVGFGDPPVVEPDLLHGPDLLSFADIEVIEVPALPLEQHVAEKVHAYSRSYPGGRSSTRVKDLVDLVLIAALFAFEAGRLRRALSATFDARATHPIPASFPPPPPGWGPPYRKLATEVGLQPDVLAGQREAASFLDPVLAGQLADDARWDLVRRSWA